MGAKEKKKGGAKEGQRRLGKLVTMMLVRAKGVGVAATLLYPTRAIKTTV